MVIEGSSASAGGARINVDLTHLRSTNTAYSLFPGQIVAMEGMNPTGRKMTAHRICEGAAHKPNTTSVRKLREYHHDMQDGAPLKIMTACGPFTTSDTTDYQPFVDLMYEIMDSSPDVVVLAGPFVDMRQTQIKEGKTTIEIDDGVEKVVSYENFFAYKIAGLIEEAFSEADDMNTQFILVPSVDDATSSWV